MKRPSIEKIISVMKSKDYRVYDTPSIDWNLNIIGIRAKSRIPNKFDDLLVVFHRFLGNWDASYYPITTDPSPHYLKNPLNPDGTAILVPGQYLSTYKIGIHNGPTSPPYKAVCQRLGDVSVYRDDNRDGKLNMKASTIQTGEFKINIHKGPRGGDWDSENTDYSAGCQVFADDRHFKEFLLKCESGKEAFGNSFTYTLLLERDFT